MEALDISTIMAWRAVERLIGVLIGGGAIYLGFRLFMALPQRKSDAEGKFDLPGGISIYVSRVGPGVFFALFGTALVSLSFLNTVRLGPTDAAAVPATAGAVQVAEAAPQAAAEPGTFSYFSGDGDDFLVSAERAAVMRDIRTLNVMEATLALSPDGGALSVLGEDETARLLIALPRIKRMMLHGVWDPEWGDYAAFAQWTRAGAAGPPPEGLDPAIAALFRRPD